MVVCFIEASLSDQYRFLELLLTISPMNQMTYFDSQSVVAAVQTALSPNADVVSRASAHKVLETVREQFPPLDQLNLGVQLATSGNDLSVRHFGLQLIESCIKYKWTQLEDSGRSLTKDNTMELAATGLSSILDEPNYIVDIVSRCICEMAKREWPQTWPSFMDECEKLCDAGAVQSHVAIYALIRLIEDVAILQTVEPRERRRDLHNSIIFVLPGIVSLIVKHLNFSPSLKAGPAGVVLCERILQAIPSLVEWLPTQALEDKTLLLDTLFGLLNTEHTNVKLFSCCCLWRIAHRKFKSNEKNIGLLFLEQPYMNRLLETTSIAASSSCTAENYTMLKNLCYVFSGIGGQIVSYQETKGHSDDVENFELFLSAIMAFLEHASLTLNVEAVQVLCNFAKNNSIVISTAFAKIYPHVVEDSTVAVQKKRFLQNVDSVQRQIFILSDYDEEAELQAACIRLRYQMLETVKLIANIVPESVLDKCSTWVTQALQSVSSISMLELEALTKYLDYLLPKVFQKLSTKDALLPGLRCLDLILSVFPNIQSPETMSYVLSCLSSFSPLLSYSTDKIPVFIELIFRSAVVPADSSLPRTELDSIHTLRSHAPLVLIKMANDLPSLLLPYFNDIMTALRGSAASSALTLRQICCFVDALALLSNRFGSYSKQKDFIDSVLSDTVAFITSSDVTEALKSSENFLEYLGLTKEPVENSAETNAFVEKRKTFIAHVVMVQNVIKRMKVPKDCNEAVNGGYVISNGDSEFYKHPLFSVMQPLFLCFFRLCRCLNGFYTQPAMQKIHPGYGVFILDATKSEKATLTGVVPACEGDKMFPRESATDFVQSFLWQLTEHAMTIVGCFFVQFRTQFFQIPEASQFILEGLLGLIQSSLNGRLRYLIRFSMRPLVESLDSVTAYQVAAPSLALFINLMYTRLSSTWQETMKQMDDTTAEAEPSLQEIYVQEVTRILTREYIDFLVLILRHDSNLSICNKTSGCDENKNGFEYDAEDQDVTDNTMEDTCDLCPNLEGRPIACFAKEMLSDTATCSPVLLTLFHTFIWRDTAAVFRSLSVSGDVINYMCAQKRLDSETATHLYFCVLSGLQIHGQHENILSPLLMLGLDMYTVLRPLFPELRSLMLTIPYCTAENLDVFEGKIIVKDKSQGLPDKVKKELFKKLVKPIIGTNVGQQLRKPVDMRRLPKLLLPSKPKPKQPPPEGLSALFAS